MRAKPILLLLALSACSSDPPVVASFVAEPATIDAGGETFLRWEVTGAVQIKVSDGSQFVYDGADAKGGVKANPATTATYVLTAVADDGTENHAYATVTVRKTPRVVSFAAAPDKVKAGATVKLGWITEDATAIDIFDGEKNLPLDPAVTSASTELKVLQSTHFVLTAHGEAADVQAAVDVLVYPLPTVDAFSSSPPAVDAGSAVTLAWSCRDADVVKIKDDQDRTLPLGLAGTPKGSFTTTPDQTTTYTLLATGPGGETSQTLKVVVRPVIKSFKSDVTAQVSGGKVLLQWTTAGTTAVTVREGTTDLTKLTGVAALTGSYSATVPATTAGLVSYTLAASNGTDLVTQTLDVLVGDAPVVSKFAAEPPAVLSGGVPNLAWQTSGATKVSLLSAGTSLYSTTSVAKVASGTFQAPALTADKTFELVAQSSIGIQTKQSFTVKVVPPPQVLNFAATPQTLTNGGDQTQLKWTTSGGAAVRIVDGLGFEVFATTDPAIASSGSTNVRPAKSQSYTLTVTGPSTDTSTRATPVTVTNPLAFSATPALLVAGARTTVSWDVSGTGAASVDLVPRPFTVGAAAFEDLSASGTEVVFATDDDALAQVALPAGFLAKVGATTSGTVTVSTNGWLGLGTYASALPQNGAALADAVAPFWDDLRLGTGKVYWELRGTTARYLLVSWQGVALKSTTGTADGNLNFQAALFEDGTVELRYAGMTAADVNRARGAGATVALFEAQPSFASVDSAAVTATSSLQWPAAFGSSGTGLLAPLASLDVSLSATVSGAALRAQAPVRVLRPGEVDFTEVMFDAPQGAAGQWLELRNRAPFDVDLSQLTLSIDGKTAQLPAATLAKGGRAVLGVSSDKTQNGGVDVVFAYGTGLAMSGGKASLALTLNGATVAALAFDDTQGYPHVAGSALVRDDLAKAAVATDAFCLANTVYDATSGNKGTPGLANDGCHYKAEPKSGFVDLTGSAAAVDAIPSSTTAQLTVPFAFNLFGVSCPTLTVSVHGFVACVKPSSSMPTNGPIPATSAPNGVLAPFWDEQYRASVSKILTEVRGTTPDRTLVVQWSKMDFPSTSTNANLNYEVLLHENGDVELQYAAMDGGSEGAARATGGSATIGLEDTTGKIALPLGVDTAGAVAPNTGWLFRKR